MYNTLVFDLDGTLVHSAPDICAAANHAFEPLDVRKLTVDEVGVMIGNGLPKLLERAFAAVGVQPDQRQFDETYDVFLSYYAKHPAVLSGLYPNTREVLEEFINQGLMLCVCTNKLEAIALDVLDGLNIRHLFSSVVGGARGRARKPDPLPLIKAVTDAGGDPGSAIMIGDSAVDAGAAKAARCPIVLVTFGYSLKPVSSLGATRLVDTMTELPGAVHCIDRDSRGAA